MARAALPRCIGALCAVLIGAPAAAHAAWHQPAGGPSPINQAGNQSGLQPSLAGIGGVPYVAWRENDGVNSEIRVSRLNAPGTAWEQVVGGASPVNRVNNQNAQDPSLTAIGGVPYIAWSENDSTNFEIRVAHLNETGTAWEEVVGGVSPINAGANQNAVQPSLTAIGGIPYVAWAEDDGGNVEIRVARLNGAGTAWEQVVGGASPINQDPNQNASDPSLIAIGGVPYVAWTETDGTNREIRVSRLNATGTAWEQVVGGASPINDANNHDATGPSLTAIGGVPYVAWEEQNATFVAQIRVSRLNGAGTAWEQVVGGPSPINHSTGEEGFEPSLFAIGGVPYVAWDQFDSTNEELRVARLNAAGAAWEHVIGGPSPINQAADRDAQQPSLAAIGGVPYVAWREGDGTNDEVRVSRLEPELTAPQALVTDTRAVLLSQVNSYGVPYTVAFDHGPGTTLGNRTTTQTTSGGADTVAQVVDGLTPATGYSADAIGTDGTYSYAPSPVSAFSTLATQVATVPGPATVEVRTNTVPQLLVAIFNPRLKARSGRRVTVEYVATGTGSATLEVLKGRTRVARVTGRAKVGRNKIAWNGKRGRKKASRGKYALRLTVTGGDGQTASDRGAVTLGR